MKRVNKILPQIKKKRYNYVAVYEVMKALNVHLNNKIHTFINLYSLINGEGL